MFESTFLAGSVPPSCNAVATPRSPGGQEAYADGAMTWDVAKGGPQDSVQLRYICGFPWGIPTSCLGYKGKS